MNLYFDDFALGQTYKSPKERVVLDETIKRFAELSGDLNRLHLDDDFAGRTPFKGRIAHGLLGLSIASGLLHDCGIVQESITAFTKIDWKFKGPVRIGDRLSMSMDVVRLRPMGARGGIVVFNARLLTQEGKIVQEGSWTVMVRKKP